MSQYDSDFQSPYAADAALTGSGGPPRTTPLAIWSLVCSLIFCCPITTILGPILGFVALSKIKRDPSQRGRGLAISGIIIGILATVIVGGLGIGAIVYGMKTQDAIATKPVDALVAGFSGDTAGFRAQFSGRAGLATDDEVSAFLDALEARYGTFQTARHDAMSYQSNFSWADATSPVQYHPFRLTFANATVTAEFGIMQTDPDTGGILFGDVAVIDVTVVDSELGDLTFPQN